jgi:hypothetical protein
MDCAVFSGTTKRQFEKKYKAKKGPTFFQSQPKRTQQEFRVAPRAPLSRIDTEADLALLFIAQNPQQFLGLLSHNIYIKILVSSFVQLVFYRPIIRYTFVRLRKQLLPNLSQVMQPRRRAVVLHRLRVFVWILLCG